MRPSSNASASLKASALGVLLLASAVAGAEKRFSVKGDAFDGRLTASTSGARTASLSSDPWTVFVNFSAELEESGKRNYMLAIGVYGEHWSFPAEGAPLTILVRHTEGGEWTRDSLEFAGRWLDSSSGKTTEVVGFSIPSLEKLRELTEVVAIRFRLSGHHHVERLFAPRVLGFDGFAEYVEQQFEGK